MTTPQLKRSHDRKVANLVTKNGKQVKTFQYPLIEHGITRDKAENFILQCGLPVPQKSACWFCIYGARRQVLDSKARKQYDLLQKWVMLEYIINKKRSNIGRDNMYFYPMTRGKMMSLWQAIQGATQMELFEELCDSGYCGL